MRTKKALFYAGLCALLCAGCSSEVSNQLMISCTCLPTQLCCDDTCVEYITDRNNCGGCGVVCSPEESCLGGECTTAHDLCGGCEDGTECCGYNCLDTSTDPQNCGGCGITCGISETCVNGSCQAVTDACGGCDFGLECCGFACADTVSDPKNCGTCGNACPDGMICKSGRCADEVVQACTDFCQPPRVCCNDVCIHPLADTKNCGSCGWECDTDEHCVNGRCAAIKPTGSCDSGCPNATCCGNTCTDLRTDADNCGSCGHSCATNAFCNNGECSAACVCPSGQVCNASGECVEPCGGRGCDKNQICCNDKCVAADMADHCGTCDNKCSGNTPVCSNGTCVEGCLNTPESMLCGSKCVNTTNDSANCGSCGKTCTSSQHCVAGNCECKPKSCAELGKSCGTVDDGCGNALECGSCAQGQTCNDGVCGCKPKSCSDLGLNCGTADDGCGKSLNCGSCAGNQTCNNGVCGCKPKTCADLGKNCGSLSDGCGGTLNCGSCAANQTCTNNVCNCNPTTCQAQGKNCGSISDGCGGSLNCGSCSAPNTCQGNVCKCSPKSCGEQGKNCGTIGDGCGGSLNCGSCGGGQTCKDNVCKSNTVANTYPTRKSIKGLQPDFQDINQVIGNETHGVAMNLVWETWQPTQTGNCGGGQVKYDGNCFNIEPNTANTIKAYSDAGVVVTAVIYGVPAWARRACNNNIITAPYFCAPTEQGAKDYGRFVGFLANYFNGEQGHGRIADFVIHNEVNASEWFNPGCQKGTCNIDTWTTVYAQSWNAAYDYARQEQKNAKVLISFTHFFGSTFDSQINNTRPIVSAETFLKYLIPKLGNRDWRIAWHAYPPNLTSPNFGADDWPRITFGNIGVLEGWLRKNYPNDPHAWEIQLTENGINGVNAGMYAQQNSQLCQAFRNLLGTPGVESFIYHRLVDHPTEVAAGLGCGLWASNGSPKPSWTTFALANRHVDGYPACGFEYLPYVKMARYSKNGMHWITTRQPPSGFKEERSWRILRAPAANTKLVFECRVGGASGSHTMISPDPNCEGQFSMGPMGYVYNTQVAGTVPIYRCYVPGNGSHFVSPASNCEGQTTESLVGYVFNN